MDQQDYAAHGTGGLHATSSSDNEKFEERSTREDTVLSAKFKLIQILCWRTLDEQPDAALDGGDVHAVSSSDSDTLDEPSTREDTKRYIVDFLLKYIIHRCIQWVCI